MTIFAIDVGTKTIGIAKSDPMQLFVMPVSTLVRQGVKKDCEKLSELMKGIEVLVVGLPYELDGSEGRSARLARQVGEELGHRLQIQPIYVDERYTSVDAEQKLLEMNVSREKRKEVIDQVAAMLILENYLMEQRSS